MGKPMGSESPEEAPKPGVVKRGFKEALRVKSKVNSWRTEVKE